MAPPDETGVAGGNGAGVVAACEEIGVLTGDGAIDVGDSDVVDAVTGVSELEDGVGVALGTVTNSVDTVSMVTVVVGSLLDRAMLDGNDDALVGVALAGSTDVASLGTAADVAGLRVLKIGDPDPVTDEPRV